MTSPERPAGRRANGLAAAEFGALVDLDPRLSEALLDRLRSAGVAAYVEPAGNAQPLVRSVVLPSRPLDRLWVDPDRADAAREVVASEVRDLTALLAEDEPGATAHGLVQAVPRHAASRVLSPPELPDLPSAPAGPPGGPPAAGSEDPDEVFRQIVAGFEQQEQGPAGVPRWPVSEDLDDPQGRDPGGPAPRRRATEGDEDDRPRRRLRRGGDPATGEQEGLPDWVEPEALDRDDADLDGGHYEPPPPPELPRISLRTAVSAVGVLLGLLLAFAPGALGLGAAFETMLVGVACMVGGAFGLVTAVRDAPPHDRGPDDGAVV